MTSKCSSRFLRYNKVAELLRFRINNGEYSVGAKIPSEVSLSHELRVSRPTIKKAITILEQEGLLECQAAVGSFVKATNSGKLIIGYIAPDLRDPFHGEVIRCLDRQLSAQEGSLTVSEGGTDAGNIRSAGQRLAAGGAAGLIVSAATFTNWQEAEAGLPPLVWCAGIPEGEACDRVGLDNSKGIADLLTHLQSSGISKVSYVSSGYGQITEDLRYQIFSRQAKIRNLTVRGEWLINAKTPGETGGREAMRKLLSGRHLPGAVVCYNDWTAIGLISEALQNGVQVPLQLKVTGFDNLLIGRYFQVPLTTIDYRIPELIRHTLGLLSDKISNPAKEPCSCLLAGELVVRESA